MRKTVLLFESDADEGEGLLEALAPLRAELRVVLAADGAAALDVVAAGPVDLLVVDLDAPLLDGFLVAARVLRLQPSVPVVLLTGAGSPQLSRDLEERHLRALRKPLLPPLLRQTVLSALAGSTHGHLRGVSAAGILQLMSLERRSGVLRLELPTGWGRLVVQAGELIDASAPGARGEEAVFRLAAWLAGHEAEILLEDLEGETERTIERSLDAVLLEASRRRDEAARGAADDAPARAAEPAR